MRSIALRGDFAAGNRVLILGFYALFLLSYIYAQVGHVLYTPIPSEYDERHHVSFILSMKADAELFPRYEDLRLVDLENSSEFTTDRNFLPHPSFYYILLSGFADADDTESIFKRLRFVNLGISTAALVLVFAAGYFWLGSVREHLVFGLVGIMNPPLAALGGQVTNDNMALLGSAIALLGLLRLSSGVVSPATAVTIGTGFAIAAMSKLTGGLLVGVMVVAVHSWMAPAFRRLDRERIIYLLVLGGLTTIGMLPYLHNLTAYGAPIRVDLSPIGGGPTRLGIGEFFLWFVRAIPATWSIYPPAKSLQILTLLLLVLLAGFGAWRGLRSPGDGRRGPAVIVASCAVAAAFVLPIHFVFSYWQHLNTGANGGAHIRFYLPLWGGMMFGVAMGVAALGSEARRAATTVVLALLLTYSSLVSAKQDRFMEILDGLCLPTLSCRID